MRRDSVIQAFRVRELQDHEFELFRSLIYRRAGISLGENKKILVATRLLKRLRHHDLETYYDYYRYATGHPDEMQRLVDALTTNETHFFREPAHFHFLGKDLLEGRPDSSSFRVWCAACSTGQEAYSIAMVCQDRLGEAPWRVYATDINQSVVETARRAIYPLALVDEIPEYYRSRYCLRGAGDMQDCFAIEKRLRDRVDFQQLNLHDGVPATRDFDCIFLRNILIYFDAETKQQLVERLLSFLKTGGYLITGHAEGLNNVVANLRLIRPSVYQRL